MPSYPLVVDGGLVRLPLTLAVVGKRLKTQIKQWNTDIH